MLRESLLAVALLAVIPGLASALDGIVVLPDGTTVPDATVSILGLTGATRTGADGTFTWVPSPRAPFSVLVVLPGGVYSSPVLIQELPSDGQPVRVQIRLMVSETVTVTAGSTPHTEAPPASAATLVGREELMQGRPANLAEAVESVPGASRLGQGHAAVPALRGLARGRTLLLIDGGRVTSERRAGPSATYLDPFFLEAIEVSRGFGSVAYGSDAFGGIIHARTRQPAPDRPLQARVRGTLGAGVPEASFGTEVSKGWADGGVLLQGRYRDFDDYRSPEGDIAVSSARDGGFRSRLDQEWGPGRLHLAWQSDFGRDVGKPAADSEVEETTYPTEDSHRLTAGYAPDPLLGFSRVQIEGFFGWYRIVTERDRLPTASSPRRVRASDIRARDYGLRVSGSRPVGNWRIDTGLDLNGRVGLEAVESDQLFEEPGSPEVAEITSIQDAARHDAGVYASVDGSLLGRLSLSAGVRLDDVRTRNTGGYFGDRSTSNTDLSGFVSMTAGPLAGTTVTGQAGWGFRDPTLSDRYYRGVTGRGFATGNPDLEPERSLQYDLAIRRAGPVRAALYLYRYRITELVERYRVDGDYLFRNRGEATIRGVELELQADLAWGLTTELGAQAAWGETVDDGSALDDVPSEALTLTLRRGLGQHGSAWLRTRLQARDERPGPTELETPAHVGVDGSLAWRWGASVETRVVVKNLLDEAYPVSPDDVAILAPGRSAALTVTATF